MRKTFLAVALIMLAGALASAEVTVIMDGEKVVGTLEIFNEYDFPPLIYSQVRSHADPDLLLNPNGDWQYDGPPSILMNPVTRLPEAVWSYREGYYRHVAWSRFDGESWSDPEFLTTGIRAKDPRLWIDVNGNRRVAYWDDAPFGETDGVYHTLLPAGETQWWAPQLLSDPQVPARRPEIRSYPGSGTFVAAESGSVLALSVVVYNVPELAPGTPQRESDPWGRVMLRDADTPLRLNLTLTSLPGPGGLVQPAVTWIELSSMELVVGTMYYDIESGSWSLPAFEPYEPW